jgi:RNA polymerase sigma factor (sigma-70 family)
VTDESAAGVVALDDAIEALSQIDPRKSKVIELRFFAGLTIEEAAAALDVSVDTVMRDWRLAKAWLSRELRRTRM